MASVNGATCAMCIKSPAMLAECSPGGYQQRIRRFKIKRPFNLRIDIDQKECSCLQSAAPRGVVLNFKRCGTRIAAATRDLGITGLREQNMISIRTLSACFAAVALSIATVAASAEKWPERPIKVISPFTAGNASDTVARIVFNQVSRQIGQTLFIENRPGAGGTLAADFVAKSDPDGYTLLLSSASLSSQVIFHKTLPYDAIRAFAPVSLIGIQPTVVIASPSRGFMTLADLVAAATAKPGTLTFASAGVGSASHMAAERLRVAAAIDVRHIPFRGAEGLTEVMAGRVDFSAYPVAPAVPLINAGKLRVLAVSTRKRAALLPNVPTVAEAGYR